MGEIPSVSLLIVPGIMNKKVNFARQKNVKERV
jgi:hypothetical protein